MSNSDHSAHLSNSSDCPACPESPVLERISANTKEIGDGFTVRRAVPSVKRRMVGPWCFLDHAGPATFGVGEGLNVGPHPHIGLQTFTWMISGEVMHYDNLGYQQLVRPGQVNLMTAGSGITHAEVSPADWSGEIHAAQLWIALPDSERNRAPNFQHYPDLPIVEQHGFIITVLAGEFCGRTAPAEVFSPLVGVDFFAETTAKSKLKLNPDFEHALLCLEGEANIEGESLAPGTLLYLGKHRDEISISCDSKTRLLLVGGEPFEEEILVWWNFVARTKDEIVKATDDWNSQRHFKAVPDVSLARLTAPKLGDFNPKPSN